MQLLKQSTAATIKIGPFVDDTDGKTAETGLTIAQADIRLSKNGGAFAQTNNATGATHDENGWYGIPLDTTDTNTLGRLIVAINESGALPVWQEFLVVTAVVYDSLVSGTDYLQVDVMQLEGDTTAAANLNSACDNYTATRGLSGTALPAAAADSAGGLPISDAGGLDIDILLANLDATISSRLDSASYTAPLSQADIRTAIGIASANLDTQIATLATLAKLKAYVQLLARKDSAIATDAATELGEINNDEGSGAGAYANTTDSQEAIRDNQSGASDITAIKAVTDKLDTMVEAVP